MKKALKLFIVPFVIICTIAPVFAASDEIYTSLFGNTGAGGYDVVAYFTENSAIEGNDSFSTEYKNVEWLFSSAKNLNKFQNNPEMYAPQFGGYCAWAVANGDIASGDPERWVVHNDKLYLNYDANVQAMWTADKDNLINLGNTNWPSVLN